MSRVRKAVIAAIITATIGAVGAFLRTLITGRRKGKHEKS